MPTGIEVLNDRLARTTDDGMLFFFYPPELAVTKKQLLTELRSAPLPDAPPPPEPPPQPPTPPIEEYGVTATSGLAIRREPKATAGKIGVLAFNDVVEVQGTYPDAASGLDYTQLIKVNGLKFTDVGFVARKYLYPKG